MRLAGLVVLDAVLAHVHAAAHRVLAQRHVVLLGAGQVLEHVAELVGRDHAEVDLQAVVGDAARAGLAAAADVAQQLQLA